MTTEPTLPTTGVQSLSPSHHNQMDDSELSKLYHSSKEIVWVIVAENVKPKFDTFEIHATGFSVAPNGVIMTCAHIFRQYSVSDLKIKVRKLSDQNKGFVQATVQSIFPHFDVAILKAQDVNDSKYGILASDGSLESGETIFHIGHSAQLIGSFLVGRAGYQCIEDVIIPSMDGLTCDRYETDVYEVTPRYRIKGHYLNTDADYDFDFDKHLHPLIPVIQCNGLNCREGSSGGPLFNTRGEIVGMYVSVFRGYDIGVHVTLLRTSGLRRTRLGRLNPQFSVAPLSNFSSLTSFNASGFLLPGSIPDWFGQSLFTLQVLDLRSCSIVGSIPPSLGNLTNLSFLYLSSNTLTGTIPTSLGQLSRLSVLDLSQNSFTGSIPMSFSSLSNLTLLDLSSNFLSGSIPPALGNLTNLQNLNLFNNSLSASVPAELGELSRLVDLDLGLNSLLGSLPTGLRGLRSLQRMVMGNNSLTGDLPESLFSNLTQLQFVVFSHNSLSGALPDLFWSMPELSFLDVSYNNFTGTLPSLSSGLNTTFATFNLSHNNFYGNISSQLRRFSFIDLSGNYFEGEVVGEIGRNASLSSNCLRNVSNQRTLRDCTAFYSERGLIFDNFGNPNTTIPPQAEQRQKSNRRLVFILAGVFGGLAFIIVLVLVLVLCLRKRETSNADQGGRTVGPVPAGGSTPPPPLPISFSNLGESFTYEQLMRATEEFGDLNLIKHGHSGDLFRGVLETGNPIVIKRIDLNSFKKESYVVELELFSKTSHPRFVPLLGHCLEQENEKILVYKYMPNGDLSNSLYRKSEHEDDSLQSLDWITRLKIAIGAAEGLSYLHHECNPPLVHRDIQASSILLDDKFEVRLGSLSEVCKQEGDAHQSVITRLLRLPQSSDQGASGSSSATCAYDVYCFGKVLLELVTGKLGISASDNATTSDWLEQTLPQISIYERELVTKIVDPSLIVDEDLLEEVWAMAVVAKSCLNPKPSKRPLMRYILKALENPLKVVREENTGSARLRTTSSRGSWNAAVFGSWRQSSSDIVGIPGPSMREGSSSLKQSGTQGSNGSGGPCGGGDLSSSNKKLSRDVFPEPGYDVADVERQEQE